MLRHETPDPADRIDVHDGYATYATATGTLPVCVRCGALVGDRDQHTAWHEDEARRVGRGLLQLKRENGGRKLGLS